MIKMLAATVVATALVTGGVCGSAQAEVIQADRVAVSSQSAMPSISGATDTRPVLHSERATAMDPSEARKRDKFKDALRLVKSNARKQWQTCVGGVRYIGRHFRYFDTVAQGGAPDGFMSTDQDVPAAADRGRELEREDAHITVDYAINHHIVIPEAYDRIRTALHRRATYAQLVGGSVAEYLAAHQEYLDRLDVAAHGGRRDNRVSAEDVTKTLANKHC